LRGDVMTAAHDPHARIGASPTGLLLALAVTLGLGGCFRVGTTEVTVKDPSAVGVVAREDKRWLLAPETPAGKVELYDNPVAHVSLVRSSSEEIHYVSKHWSLYSIEDDTTLLDARGRLGGSLPWAMDPLGGSASLVAKVAEDKPVEVPIAWVKSTGGLGCDPNTGCAAPPVMGMSLSTGARNVKEVSVTYRPPRALGLIELVFAPLFIGGGLVDGGVNLAHGSSENRNIALGVDAGLVAIGGALLASGLWYWLAPERHAVVYEAPP
jgi:hypothetical protein